MGAMSMAVVVAVTFVFVVTVRHDACGALSDGRSSLHMFARWLSSFENPKLPVPIHVMGILTRAS